MALALSSFTHLWNNAGYPIPDVDEGVYLGRAINFMEKYNPLDPYDGYDHPYFGQIFLSGFLYLVGYQNILSEADLNHELITLIPRIIMGILAILDTFLIFKIAKIRYTGTIAFIASILFAVTPLTLQTRWILLDSIQLPFILSSIYIALLSGKSDTNGKMVYLLTLFSGILMGLSIFVKIPGFTMIPLASYILFSQNRKRLKYLGIWFIPVLVIPALWPIHALSLGQLGLWWDAIIWQTERESHSLFSALSDFLSADWILFVLGFTSLIFAAIRRDIFILLFTIPFLFFMYAIGYVSLTHLMLLAAVFSISTAIALVKIVNITKKKRLLRFSSIGLIIAVVAIGVTNSTRQIIVGDNSQYFLTADFIDKYLQPHAKANIGNKKGNNDTSIVSNPFFFWVNKYKYTNENSYFWDNKQFETSKIVFVIDSIFRTVIQENEYGYGTEFRNLFTGFYTHTIASFKSSKDHQNDIEVLETDLHRHNKSKINIDNIFDKNRTWNHTKFIQLYRQNGVINMTVNTTNASAESNLNSVFLNNAINFSRPYGYLNLSYYVPVTSDATYTFEIIDAENNMTLWEYELLDITDLTKNEFFILPPELYHKEVHIKIKAESYSKKIDSIIINEFSVYH